jgi:hypothetical protein
MADRKHVLHVKSNVVTPTDKYGITGYEKVSKRPNPQDILPGEIALNYGKDGELLTIKNSNGEIVGFVNENEYLLAQKITAAAIATEKTDRINAINEAVTAQKAVMTQNIISLSYTELKALRDNEKLKPGQFYRINDYITSTSASLTQSANHPFDIVVMALDNKTLSENAAAIQTGERTDPYTGEVSHDTYFDNSNLNAWQLKYCIDNDKIRFDWADDTDTTISFTGTSLNSGEVMDFVYNSHGDYGYIWKSIDGETTVFTENRNPEVGSEIWDDPIEQNIWGTVQSLNTTPSGKGVIYYMKDEYNNECPYDFKNIMFQAEITINGSVRTDYYYTFTWVNGEGDIEDAAIVAPTITTDQSVVGVYDNVIKPCYAYEREGSDDAPFTQMLNEIIFVSDSYYSSGHFGGIRRNKFGNDCYLNIFRNICNDNVFGSDCNNNTFGNQCHYNTFGNQCYYNTFGSDCNNNTFGNYCNNNTFTIGCPNNTIGNECNHITFNNASQYVTVESGNQSITLKWGGEDDGTLRNITIAQGNTPKTIVHKTSMDNFKTVYYNTHTTVDGVVQ